MERDVPLPPPPAIEAPPRQGWVGRSWAIVGIVGGFLFFIVPGFFSIRSYRRWRAGTIRKPIFAWTFAWIGVVYVAAIAVASLALPDELLIVDFRDRVDPFEVGENSAVRSEHVDGTYRLTVKDTLGPVTSLGELVRTAYAVGVRAEVVEMSEPGTTVGAMCLGPAAEGAPELAGYGFFVEPGGDYILGRQDPDARIDFLERGTDARIETVEHVSIICAPDLDGDVTLIGFANGLEIVSAEDRGGYTVYTHAGLSVISEQIGAEVRFHASMGAGSRRRMGALNEGVAAPP